MESSHFGLVFSKVFSKVLTIIGKMNLIGNINLEVVSSSEDETLTIVEQVLLAGILLLVLMAGLAIQRRLGIFLKNHDSRIINRIIQSHRVRKHM
jgi:hypothetical protein